MRLLLALFLVSTALAGCSDDAKPATDDASFDDLGLDADSTTGVIRGLVVDAAITPVPDATITLVASGATTTSNENGAFGFSNLAPGTYFLEVSKPGYGSTQQSAVVEAGVAKPPITKVLLARVPGSEPYFTPSEYTGYVSCGLLVANRLEDHETCDPQGIFGEDDSEVYFAAAAKRPDFVQVEVNWQQVQPVGDRLTVTAWSCDLQGDCSGEIGSPQRICQVWGPAPHICRTDAVAGTGNPDGTGGGEGLETAKFGDGEEPGFIVSIGADCADLLCVPGTSLGVGVVVQQTFDVYNHVFYNMLPVDGWVFITDGEPTVPPS